MAQVCKWLGVFLCLRENPKRDPRCAEVSMYEAIIVWKESPKESAGGMAYEVILKPATADNVPTRPASPPKEITHDHIVKKLKQAEERRQSLEAQKLEKLAQDRARAQEVIAKAQEEEEAFAKAAKEKLEQDLLTKEQNREAQIKTLQTRLKDHEKKVQEVRSASETAARELQERIAQKLEEAEEKRQSQLSELLERLKEHEKHIDEVRQTSSSFSKSTQEKMIQKMETTLKNREDQLNQMIERLREHCWKVQGTVVRTSLQKERHAEVVRNKKRPVSSCEGDKENMQVNAQ